MGGVSALARRLRESHKHNLGTTIEIPQSRRDEFHSTMENNKLRLDAQLSCVGFCPGGSPSDPKPNRGCIPLATK
eukprot:3895425-Prorocentrum_lima.AAC.1